MPTRCGRKSYSASSEGDLTGLAGAPRVRGMPRRLASWTVIALAMLAGPGGAAADGLMLVSAGVFWMGRADGAPAVERLFGVRRDHRALAQRRLANILPCRVCPGL